MDKYQDDLTAIRKRIETAIAKRRAEHPGACVRCLSYDDVQPVWMYAFEIDAEFVHEYCASCRKSLEQQPFTKAPGSA